MDIFYVGDHLPDLKIADDKGSLKPLSDQMGKNGLAIFVLRGTWCPSCVSQISGVQRNYGQYSNKGVQSVFISPEEASAVEAFKISHPTPLKFGLHSDPKRETTELFLPKIENSPETATYLLNKEREVVWVRLGNAETDFPTHGEVITAIETHLG